MSRMLWIVLVVLAFAAPANAADDVVFPIGSRVGLVPPPGLVASQTFIGFEDPANNVAILIVTLPANAYAELEKSSGSNALKRRGLTIDRRQPFALAAGRGFLVVGRQEIERIKLRKWILVASTLDLTAMVTVQVPESARDAYPDAAVRAALATLAVRPTIPVDEQLGLLPFKVGDLAGFRVGGVISGRAVILTDAPEGTTGSSNDPQIVIAVAPGGPSQPSERERFARDLFLSTPNLKDVHVETAEPLRIGGLPGHQIMARAKEYPSGIDVMIAQWLRFGSGGYMHLIAVARADAWTQAYARFRQVRDGIETR